MRKVNIESLKDGNNELKCKASKSLIGIDELADDVTVNMKLVKIRDKVRAKGEIRFNLNLVCSCCLNEFIMDRVENVDTLFVPFSEEDSAELDVFPYKNKEIDILQLVHDTVQLGIPIKVLCTPGCKGMCPDCGKNLNDGKCECKVR